MFEFLNIFHPWLKNFGPFRYMRLSKHKFLNFLAFLMDGSYQILVRFALRDLVSEINAGILIFEKKYKFWNFEFLIHRWYQISVRFALWGLVSEINAK